MQVPTIAAQVFQRRLNWWGNVLRNNLPKVSKVDRARVIDCERTAEGIKPLKGKPFRNKIFALCETSDANWETAIYLKKEWKR